MTRTNPKKIVHDGGAGAVIDGVMGAVIEGKGVDVEGRWFIKGTCLSILFYLNNLTI
jgi:hypothetical protein